MASAAHDVSLSELADRLQGEGYDVAELRELQIEIEVLERPPGLITRMTAKVRTSAGHHWRNFVGELRESKEAAGLLLGRAVGGQLSPEERDKVRAQLVDLVKVFPAGLIAAANSAFPVPGTGMFTPWILHRLGLMPSRWREAHLLDQLRRQKESLYAAGYTSAAEAVAAVEARVEEEAARRESVEQQARLLTHWDRNQNGEWDEDEKEAYREELARMRGLAERFGTRKKWYLDDEGEVFGALRLSELTSDDDLRNHLDDDSLLVCFDGRSGWVALPDLLGREPRFV